MDAIESAVRTVLAKRNEKPRSWADLRTQGRVMGGEPRIENGNLILPLEPVERLSKSAKTYMRYGTGNSFYTLPTGEALKISFITRWNPTYVEGKQKLEAQRKLEVCGTNHF